MSDDWADKGNRGSARTVYDGTLVQPRHAEKCRLIELQRKRCMCMGHRGAKLGLREAQAIVTVVPPR